MHQVVKSRIVRIIPNINMSKDIYKTEKIKFENMKVDEIKKLIFVAFGC